MSARHLPSRRAFVALAGATLACPALHAQTELTDLAKIRANGALKVAVYKDNAPFSDGKGSDMRGLDVALAQALAAQLQLKLALLPFDAGENMGDDLRNMVWRGHYLGYGPADVMLQVPVDRYLMQKNRQVLILAPYMRQQLVVAHVFLFLGEGLQVTVGNQIKLAAHDRLHVILVGFVHKVEGGEHVSVVGHGNGGHAIGLRLFHERADAGLTVEQGILGMGV